MEGEVGWGCTRKVIHLFQTALKNLAKRYFSFWSVLNNTVLCGVEASPTNGLGFECH